MWYGMGFGRPSVEGAKYIVSGAVTEVSPYCVCHVLWQPSALYAHMAESCVLGWAGLGCVLLCSAMMQDEVRYARYCAGMGWDGMRYGLM